MIDLTSSYENLNVTSDPALRPGDNFTGSFTVIFYNDTTDPVDSQGHFYLEIMRKDDTIAKYQINITSTVTVPPQGYTYLTFNFSIPLSDIITNKQFYLKIVKYDDSSVYLTSSYKFDILPNLPYIKSILESDYSNANVGSLKSAFGYADPLNFDSEYEGSHDRQSNFIGYNHNNARKEFHISSDCINSYNMFDELGQAFNIYTNYYGRGYLYTESDGSNCALKMSARTDNLDRHYIMTLPAPVSSYMGGTNFQTIFIFLKIPEAHPSVDGKKIPLYSLKDLSDPPLIDSSAYVYSDGGWRIRVLPPYQSSESYGYWFRYTAAYDAVVDVTAVHAIVLRFYETDTFCDIYWSNSAKVTPTRYDYAQAHTLPSTVRKIKFGVDPDAGVAANEVTNEFWIYNLIRYKGILTDAQALRVYQYYKSKYGY